MNPIITAILSIVSTVVGGLSEVKKTELAILLQESQAIADIAKAQAEVNAAEASNSNIFVAGWRPFVGWVCGMAFAWQFVIQPILTYLIVVSGHPIPQLPVLDTMLLMNVLFGMLGLGAMRSYEKIKGVK